MNFDKFEVCFGKNVHVSIRDKVTDFLQVKQVKCHENI